MITGVLVELRYVALVLIAATIAFTSLRVSGAALFSANEEALKVAFVYNFTKFTEWPHASDPIQSKNIVLCVLGHISFHRQLAVVDGKVIGNQSVVVKYLRDGMEVNRCQVLFVGEMGENERLKVLGAVQPFPVLTISDQRNFIESGGMVEIFETNRQLRFRVNREKIEHAGIKLSSHVLKLAITTEP